MKGFPDAFHWFEFSWKILNKILKNVEKKYNKLELKASLESGKIASDKLMKKYGANNLKRLDTANKITNIASIAGLMALPIGAIALGMRK